MSGLDVVDIHVRYGPLKVLNGVSLSVEDGRFMTLLGPSGCGKTTLLRVISGFSQPERGEIYIKGERVDQKPTYKRGIGLVFQNYAVFSHMTVRDNLAFGLKVRKMPADEIRSEVLKTAETLELTDILGVKAGKLRLDEMQRTALGRSMITRPAFFLLDEPLSNLDAGLRSTMRVELKRIQRELEQTILYVTHDQVEAMSMADRIAVMDHGVLQQYGSRDALYSHPANRFVATFIGSPTMNFTDCTLVEKDNKAYLDASDFRIDATQFADTIKKEAVGSELIMGIRPENVSLSQAKSASSTECEVFITEPIGPKTIVTVSIGRSLIRSIAPGRFKAEIGDKLHMNFDMQKLHVFDKKTEKAIF